MNIDRTGRAFLILTSLALMAGTLSIAAGAQTRRPKTKAIPVASPTPLTGDAEVIRTADQTDQTIFVNPADVKPVDTQTNINTDAQKVKELSARVKKLEAARTDPYEEKQKRLLLNLDILTRAEQRSESLRKQLFDMIEKENSIKSRLDQLDFDSRPEMLSRSATYSGSMKPEEIRDMRKKSLDAERANLQSLMTEIQANKANLSINLERSDALVEKLRLKLDKDIDASFKDDEPDQ